MSGFCDCSSEEKERDEHHLLGGEGAAGHQEPDLAHAASKLNEVWVKLRFFSLECLRIWRNYKRRAVELFSPIWTLYCTDIYVHGVAVI